ncbi:L-ascorbate oxidase [Linum grandiflorum]
MTVVEADGNYVEPFETASLYVYSGETYSVLVKADQPPTRNYWITTSVVARKPSTPQGIAIVDMSNYDIYSVAENVNTTLSSRIYRLEFNSTVDVVLQNANTMTPNNSEAHPWHLHGHDFWVLGYGEGKYDPTRDKERYNLVDPVMKNTVPLHPYGWTAIRFRANNPGVWFFHCHIESHFFMGMAVVFEEGSWMVGRLPSSVMGCGKTKPVDPANSP